MSLQVFRTVACKLAIACCALTILSCERSPLAPTTGRVLVYVSENNTRPAPGKTIEIVGTSLRQDTDENGEALFIVSAGSYVVRAYELGGPGPGFPFVDQSVEVVSARTSRAVFNDCTLCVSPSE